MRQTPTKEELLGAVADFLDGAVRPALEDRGLAFRLRIATNLLRTVSMECVGEDAADREELQGLRWLLKTEGDPPADRKSLRRALRESTAQLAAGLKDGVIPDGDLDSVGAHLRATLAVDLSLINPRFDRSPDIESA